jgi:hypothetical protein
MAVVGDRVAELQKFGKLAIRSQQINLSLDIGGMYSVGMFGCVVDYSGSGHHSLTCCCE